MPNNDEKKVLLKVTDLKHWFPLKKTKLFQKAKIYKGLQSPKYQEKLRNARLCNNDKSAFYLPRHSLKASPKSQ